MSTADRRQLIVQAAERLVAHYGVHKTTVADIAREAQIGVGSVYLEFSSKDAILEWIAGAKHQAILDTLGAALQEGDFAHGLRRFFEARVSAFRESARCGAHGAELVHCTCPAVQAKYRAFEIRELDILREYIDAGSRAGHFTAPDPESSARALLRAYSSFAPPQVFGLDDEQLERGLRQMHDLVLSGILSRP